MRKEDLEAIRDQLLGMREELLSKLRSRNSEAAGLSDEGVPDLEDLGLHDNLREFLHLLSDRDREKVLRIDDALERIHGGRYGLCERCEEPIEIGRLKLQPDSLYCHDCQEEIEAEAARKAPGQGTL